MIRKIKFSNFYSFKDEQEINFLTSKKKTFDFTEPKKNGEQITKIAGFIGGNASGKTNIIRVFSFISHFIISSSRPPVLDIPFKTFFNNKKESNFYIEFENDINIFKYELSVLENIIIKEKLQVKEKKDNAKTKDVFLRKSIKNKNSIETFLDLKKTFFPKDLKQIMKTARPDISLISFIKTQYNINIINQFTEYFIKATSNINEKGETNFIWNEFLATEYYWTNSKALEGLNEFIKSFDLGIEKVKIEKKIIRKDVQGEEIEYKKEITHKTKKEGKKVDWEYESKGTRQIYTIFARFHQALENNSLIVFDELETAIHPEAFKKIISYFINQNEKGIAQLIFTSHTLGFLNKFSAQQIFLVEKNNNGESEVYRLDELKPRADQNFYSKYMSGAYGAFPKINT